MGRDCPKNHMYPEKNEGNIEGEIKKIHRGVWAEKLSDSQELPVGGSIFSKELTTKLELDFSSFDEELSGFNEENIRTAYEKGEESLKNWLKNIGSDVDPYTYFVCHNVQNKVNKLLEVDPNSSISSSERKKRYGEEKMPKLSELVGMTECAERAALGKYILQKVGMDSTYVSGVMMNNAKDENEYPEDHSFIVLKNPNDAETSLVFDVARPHLQHNLPRIFETDANLTYDLLKDKEELLIGSKEVLQGGKGWFGVGEPIAGYHETIEK